MEQGFINFDDWDDSPAETVDNSASVSHQELERYQRQFLVHSFLYYKCNESVISDTDYDKRVGRMIELMQSPDAPASKYYSLCKEADASASGYYITEYPPEIITAALRMLWLARNKPEPFDKYITRWGYRVM